MDGDNLFQVRLDGAEEGTSSPEVHAVFVVIVGSTMAELALQLEAQKLGTSDIVPHMVVVIDSLPYEDLVNRLLQLNWTREQVAKAIPRANYFQLPSPFAEGFDFNNPLNADWLQTIFEPGLKRLAAKPEAPGCAGTPALGRARVEGSEHELRAFFESRLLELTQVRTETLGLQPGVKVFVVTTFRGGTGVGATLPAAALLRSVMSEGSIHLHSVMPDVYGGDARAYANAYAMVRETQYAHRFNGGVKFKGGRTLPAPFESVSLVFASNGAVALQPGDAVMQEAAILRAYLRARTQSTINSRIVDLTDVIPHTINDEPMHVSVMISVSIRNIQPGTLEYMAAEWCRRRLDETQAAFEEWCQSGDLSIEDSAKVSEVARAVLADLNLNRNALLSRIDGAPGAANTIRAFFEQVSATIGSMDAAPIKKSMGGMPGQVRSAFQRIEPQWQEHARNLARALPEEIFTYVMSRLADAPHLALAVIGKLIEHLTRLAKEGRAEAEAERKRRDDAGAQLAEALNAVQESKGILGLINRNEVTRDAAQRACSVAMKAALSRIEQQRLELLVQALEGEFSTVDGRGRATTVPAVTSALRDGQVSQMAAVRKRQAALLAEVKALLSDLGQTLEKRSPVFNRALVYDGASRETLNRVVGEVSDALPSAPPIRQLLKGERGLRQTVGALLPMLPNYTEFGRPLSDVLAADAKKREAVIRLLRNRVPFTPLDHVVEDQQGLRNRRDTLVVLEIPGGADGPLAPLVLDEAIVSHRNQIVDSGEDEIRLHYLREGLPYAAVRPLARYKERHDTYQAKPTAVTPYTQADARNYPGVAPSRVNLGTHTEELLYVSRAVLPERVIQRPSGGYVLRHEKESGHGFAVTQEEFFHDMGSMVIWVAKEVPARKLLEAELLALYDSAPEAYVAKLTAGWRTAKGRERECLLQALYKLKVDPAKLPDAQTDFHPATTS
jgi:hypothetical protein